MEDRTFVIVLSVLLLVGTISFLINRSREQSWIKEDQEQHNKAIKEMKVNVENDKKEY